MIMIYMHDASILYFEKNRRHEWQGKLANQATSVVKVINYFQKVMTTLARLQRAIGFLISSESTARDQ